MDELEQRLKTLAPTTIIVEMQPAREGKIVSSDPAIPLQPNAASSRGPDSEVGAPSPSNQMSATNIALPVMARGFAPPTGLGSMPGVHEAGPQDRASIIASSPRLATVLAKYPNFARMLSATGNAVPIRMIEQQLADPAYAAQFERSAAEAEARLGPTPQALSPTAMANGSSHGPAAARKELSAMGLTYFSQEQFVDAIERKDKLAVSLFLQGEGVTVMSADKVGRSPLKVQTSADIAAMLKGVSGSAIR